MNQCLLMLLVLVIVIVSVPALVVTLIPEPAEIFKVSPAWSATTLDCPLTDKVLKPFSCVIGVDQDIFPVPSVVNTWLDEPEFPFINNLLESISRAPSVVICTLSVQKYQKSLGAEKVSPSSDITTDNVRGIEKNEEI